MKTAEFLNHLDDETLKAAIAEAESRTTGEIRVYVSERLVADARQRAQWRFEKLGMQKTRDRNAVLLYFAPRVQRFAVIGDSGIHAVCGQAFWEQMVEEIRRGLQAGHFQEAVLGAVHQCGAMLALHFPCKGGGANELPDDLLRD